MLYENIFFQKGKYEMAGRLNGRTSIIFGATSKVGPAICLRLAGEGSKVVVHYHSNRDKAEQVVEDIKKFGGSAIALQANGIKETEIRELMEKTVSQFGSVDFIVNLTHKYAAVSDVMVADMTWDDWSLHLEAMQTHFFICKHAIHFMRQQHFGRIVFISGGLAYRFFKGCSVYSTVKAGLNAFCKTLALEEGENNITVNIISPGKIVNQKKTEEDIAQNRMYVEDSKCNCPLGRYASPEDVANAVLFFVSPDANGITGQTLYVSGGEIMPMP